MKPRARRIALLTVAAGCLVVAGLVTFNWSTVRDHAEAWWFAWTHETVATIKPGALGFSTEASSPENLDTDLCLRWLAALSGRPVIVDRSDQALYRAMGPNDLRRATADSVSRLLKQRGWRLVEQRLPRPAYVVVGYPAAFSTLPDWYGFLDSEVHVLIGIVGLKVGLAPGQIVDFLAGILGFDPFGDDVQAATPQDDSKANSQSTSQPTVTPETHR